MFFSYEINNSMDNEREDKQLLDIRSEYSGSGGKKPNSIIVKVINSVKNAILLLNNIINIPFTNYPSANLNIVNGILSYLSKLFYRNTIKFHRNYILGMISPILPNSEVDTFHLTHTKGWLISTNTSPDTSSDETTTYKTYTLTSKFPYTFRYTMPTKWVIDNSIKDNVHILYVHGGGCISGDWYRYKGFCSKISLTMGGAVVYFTNYRLIPEWTLKDAVDDIIETYLFMLKNSPKKQIVFMGDSGGSLIILSTLIQLKKYLSHKKPLCSVLISPMVNINNYAYSSNSNDYVTKKNLDFCNSLIKKHLGYTDDPLQHDLDGIPPIFITLSKRELLKESIYKFYKRACLEKVDVSIISYPYTMHSAPLLYVLDIPESNTIIDDIAAYIKGQYKIKDKHI